MSNWSAYNQANKNGKPRPLMLSALKYVKGKKVLDLGSGPLNDAKWLKANDYDVLAVDSFTGSQELADEARIAFKLIDFEDAFDGSYDFINAQYAIPFAKNVPVLVNLIFEHLNIGGIFAGQFFGERDEWCGRENISFHSKDEVQKMLSPFEVIYFNEEEQNRPAVGNPNKHWHVFHVIARKP